jgi:hypothetical protein
MGWWTYGWFQTLNMSIIKWGLWHLATFSHDFLDTKEKGTFVWSVVVSCNELLLGASYVVGLLCASLQMAAAPFMIPGPSK